MYCDTLAEFRDGLYLCFDRARDALMDTADALLTQTTARSLPELSLASGFRRQWSSVYETLQDAVIDRKHLQRLFAAFVPRPEAGQRLVLGVDASSLPRPQSPTGRDRTYVHASNLPKGNKPVVAGWQFSALVVLPPTASSWTYVLDNVRIASHTTAAEVAARQVTAILPRLPVRPLLLADGAYSKAGFLSALASVACDSLLRLAKNRVLYRPAPPQTGKRGAPKKDGDRFACHDPKTQGTPDALWSDAKTEVACWHTLHFKDARSVTVTVLRVTRKDAADTERDPRVSWFVFCGEELPPLAEIVPLYRRRYSQEHGFRVDKQTLLWNTPRLRTPEQMQHWTDLVAAVRNQLVLARPTAQEMRRAWESKRREITPAQVRRAMGRIVATLGTPTRLPQPRGKSPGRCVGAVIAPAPRYKVVYKAAAKPKTRPN